MYVYWYCYDYGSQCTEGVQAYSWDSYGILWSNHYTVFCDPFYSRQTMGDLMVKYNNDQSGQKVMENFHLSSGQIMFHEIWHYKDLVSSPRTDDYAYQAQAVWDLAKNKGTGSAYVNADPYALDAVAIYVQQYYANSMLPVPWRELAKLNATAAAALPESPGDNAVFKTYDQTPPGWNGPLVTDDNPNLSVWTELHLDPLPSAGSAPYPSSTPSPDPAPATDQNACHSIGGDYWVMSRDVAVQGVNDFCGQTEQIKNYNVGSVNALELSIRNLEESSKSPEDTPSCVGRFQNAVIDGRHGADPINNPHNYKFGSTLTKADGCEYKMTPLSQQVNEVNCDVSYNFWYDRFQIRGKNLPDGLFGAEGEGLHDQLSGCGALSKWDFERTPNDCCFQWYAAGHLPIGTKDCIGRALESAGGGGDGDCHGPGKREDTDSIGS